MLLSAIRARYSTDAEQQAEVQNPTPTPVVAESQTQNVLDAAANYAPVKLNITSSTMKEENRYGGKYKMGGVKKTPGEFSHSKNPIDIMKDGAKIGEMTGGEYIFNPRQASTLQSLASKGGSPLHKYVRNLLKEFDKR